MKTEQTILPNGLRIISHTMPHLGTVAVGTWFFVGSSQEQSEEHGISHFLEHMLFKGTDQRSSQEIVAAIENTGGHLNACTSREMTAYFALVMQEYLPLAVEIIADITQHPTFTAENLKCEKKVVLQEISQYRDEPDELVSDYLQQQVYPNHQLGKTILGAPTTVSGLSGQQLRSYMGKFYHPGNMILVAAGAVDHQQLVDLAARQFDSLPKAKAKPVITLPEWHGESCVYKKQLNQSHLLVAFPGVSRTADDYYGFSALLATLGGGLSARVVKAVREDYGLSYNVQTFFQAFKNSGYGGVYLSCKHADVAKSLQIIGHEWRRVADDLREDEVQKAKQQLKMAFLTSQERPFGVVERIAKQEFIYQKQLTTEEILGKIESISVEQLKALAAKHYNKPAIAVLGESDLDVPKAKHQLLG